MTGCSQSTGANVQMNIGFDRVGCPGDTPLVPFPLKEATFGSRSLSPNQETSEDPNAFGFDNSVTVDVGATSTLPFTYKHGVDDELLDAMMAGLQSTFTSSFTGTVGAVAANNTFTSTVDNFEAAGFKPHMVIDITGLAGANNTVRRIIKAVRTDTVTPLYEIEVYADALDPNFPLLTDEAEIAAVTIETNYVTQRGAEQQNIVVERLFPDVTDGSTTGIYDRGLGGTISAWTLTVEPNAFVSGSYTIDFAGYDTPFDASVGTVIPETDKTNTLYFNADSEGTSRLVDVFYDGVPLCFTTLTITQSRTVNRDATSCGTTVTGATPSYTISLAALLETAEYMRQYKNQESKPLTVMLWNNDRTQYTALTFPGAKLSGNVVEPDDESALIQTLEMRADTDSAFNSAAFIQRNYQIEIPARTRVSYVHSEVTPSFDIGIAANLSLVIDWGDGTIQNQTSDISGLTNLTHTYVGTDFPYTAVVTAVDTVDPIDFVRVTTGGPTLTAIDLSYVSPHLNSVSIQNTALPSIDVSGSSNLTSLNVNFSTNLVSVDITGCYSLTSCLLRAAALSQTTVDRVLALLVEYGQLNGTIDLFGGTNSAPSAAGLVNVGVLTSRGWTITTN